MPAPTRRPRTWSVVVALVAVVLAIAVCGPHASVRHLASNPRSVAADTGQGHGDAARTPELRQVASLQHAPEHLDLAVPALQATQRPTSGPAARATYRLTPLTPFSDAAPRGRAPPAA